MKRKFIILFFVVRFMQGMEIELIDFTNAPFHSFVPDKNVIRWRQQLSECISNNDVQSIENIVHNNSFVLNEFKKIFNGYYITPLCEAIIFEKYDCINKLLKLGADPHCTDNNGLPIFCYLGHKKGCLAQILINNGANVDQKDALGNTSLMRIISWRNLCADSSSVFSCLLKNGADVNIQDKDGNTVLHMAITLNKSRRIISELEKYGANWLLSNKKGERPIDLLTHFKWPQ